MKTKKAIPVFFTAARCGGHGYGVKWSLDNWREALRVIGRWAADPDHAFDWRAAAAMSKAVSGELIKHDVIGDG